jgi:hypothetical protein
MYVLSTYVGAHARTCACARRMHLSVRACVRARACACVRVRVCVCAREQWRNTTACARAAGAAARHATARPLDVCHHVCMCMCDCMYMHVCVRVESTQVCVRVRTCARAAGGTRARPRDVFHHAHTSAYVRVHVCVHTHTRIGRFICGCLFAISSCMRVSMDVCACVYRWLGLGRRASVYLHIYRHI